MTASPTPKRRCIMVCQNRSCVRNGSEAVLAAFQAALPSGVFAAGSACLGQCASGPTVQVNPDGTWYRHVKVEDVPEIVAEHIESDRPVKRLLHPRFHPQFDFYTEP